MNERMQVERKMRQMTPKENWSQIAVALGSIGCPDRTAPSFGALRPRPPSTPRSPSMAAICMACLRTVPPRRAMSPRSKSPTPKNVGMSAVTWEEPVARNPPIPKSPRAIANPIVRAGMGDTSSLLRRRFNRKVPRFNELIGGEGIGAFGLVAVQATRNRLQCFEVVAEGGKIHRSQPRFLPHTFSIFLAVFPFDMPEGSGILTPHFARDPGNCCSMEHPFSWLIFAW